MSAEAPTPEQMAAALRAAGWEWTFHGERRVWWCPDCNDWEESTETAYRHLRAEQGRK